MYNIHVKNTSYGTLMLNSDGLRFREHPSTIKKRFFSVFVMTLISPAPLYFGLNEKVFQKVFPFYTRFTTILYK